MMQRFFLHMNKCNRYMQYFWNNSFENSEGKLRLKLQHYGKIPIELI